MEDPMKNSVLKTLSLLVLVVFAVGVFGYMTNQTSAKNVVVPATFASFAKTPSVQPATTFASFSDRTLFGDQNFLQTSDQSNYATAFVTGTAKIQPIKIRFANTFTNSGNPAVKNSPPGVRRFDYRQSSYTGQRFNPEKQTLVGVKNIVDQRE
jgi:hypothetical protein